ncbi:OTU protein [Coemansia linderi]|uniref:OTU protein n=1 Tax=Coemansia linderi TaxID=2663919 RepID=A0ACC1KPB9_9FUNG|nr:OTU protein [Coemansia linderi]
MSSLPITETTLEDLELRHRKESKDLLAKVTALKKTVSKGDKRKKKEVAADIAALEAQQSERHAAEISQLTSNCSGSTVTIAGLSLMPDQDAVAATTGDSEPPSSMAPTASNGNSDNLDRRPGGKVNKAKQRLQRKAEELQRIQAEAEKEAEGMVDVAAIESSAIDRLVANDGLKVRQINADGHCLYSAFADQLCTYHSQSASYPDMRRRAAEYMRLHRDDFMPFMAQDNGDPFDISDYDGHCDSVERSAEWGGHQEIIALSHALKLPVLVYQSNAPVLRIGEDEYSASEPVRLSYHRHAYGLGEHYNSLHKTQ